MLEAGSQLDERRFAESRAKEADSHGQTEEVPQGYVDDGIAADGSEVRGAEEEAVTKDQVRRPCGRARSRTLHHRG
jgi:hypothetical protein